MNFLRNLLASILGTLFAFGIIFVMFFILVSLLGSTEDSVTVKDNSILELQLQRPISDYVGTNELDPFSGIFEQSQGLDEIIHAIEVAKTASGTFSAGVPPPLIQSMLTAMDEPAVAKVLILSVPEGVVCWERTVSSAR